MVPNSPAVGFDGAGDASALPERLECIAAMFLAAPDAMLIIDDAQQICLVNDAAAKMFGMSVPAMRGITIDRLIPERFRMQHHSHVSEFGNTGKTSRHETGHLDVVGLRADGTEIQIGAAISTFVDQSRRYFAVSFRDIRHQKHLERQLREAHIALEYRVTERTAQLYDANAALSQQNALRLELESQLRERERRFRAVFNNAYSFLGLLSPDGVLLEANQQALGFFDITEADVVGRYFWDTPWWQYSPESRAKLIAGVKVAAEGRFVQFEMQDHDPKDGIVDIDFSLTPVKDDSGQVVFLVPEGHKITDVKNAQRALQKAHDSLETMVQARTAELAETHGLLEGVLATVDEGIVVFDRDLRVQLWNRFLENVTHMSFKDVKGKRPWDIWPQLVSHGTETLLRRALAGETVVPDTLIGRDGRSGQVLPAGSNPSDRDDGTIWMLTKYTPLREGGQAVGVVGTSLNVGKLVRVQQRLSASNEKLRALNAHLEKVREEERSRIAQGIHDGLGGLITGIKAHVSTVIDQEQRANRPVDAKLVRACELADSAADAVRRVIADLRPSVLDQLGIWAALEWLTRESVSATMIKSECQISDEALDVVLSKACGDALFRIVQEALTNVVRHSGASHVNVSIETDADLLIAAIEDTGKGIDETELQRDDAWGLLGMQERAHRVGGVLHIERGRDGGTLVIVTMPCSTKDVN